jgi:small-conductance mechanosensitive channel
MNNILALAAFATLIVFLGILVWNVPRLDLMGVVGVTIALAGWDLYQNLKGNRG